MSRAPRLAVVASAVALLGASPASGQHRSQVLVDPESPTGKEYALPLETARRQADPSSKPGTKVVQGENASPLFGEGIEPGNARASRLPIGARGRGGSGHGSPKARTPSSPLDAAAREAIGAAAKNPGAPGSSTATALLIVAGGVLLLGLGGAAGFALRRRG